MSDTVTTIEEVAVGAAESAAEVAKNPLKSARKQVKGFERRGAPAVRRINKRLSALLPEKVSVFGMEVNGKLPEKVAVKGLHMVKLQAKRKDVVGDVAWGGNWFFLIEDHNHDLELDNVEILTDFTWSVREALSANGITGGHGQEIDHVELFGASQLPGVDSRNFVLCPGKAYDRSPCGTGTSAKMACLYADGKLREGQVWKQESIVGSLFEGSVKVRHGQVYPSIKGCAFVNAEADLILDARDPFCMGIRR